MTNHFLSRLDRLAVIDTLSVKAEIATMRAELIMAEQARKELKETYDAIRDAITHGKPASELRHLLPEFKAKEMVG